MGDTPLFRLDTPGRRAFLTGIAGSVTAAALAVTPGSRANALNQRFFRLGTGSVGGTYFPIGSTICDALNDDAPTTTCAEPPCILGGRHAVAQLSNGSISNFESLRAGLTDAALMQADVLYAGWKGTGDFTEKGPYDGVRLVANLFPESFHLAVRRDGDIRSFRDIIGHRIALDEPASGTIVIARVLLAAYGIKESDLRAEYTKWEAEYGKWDDAAAHADLGSLDGLMKVGGDPLAAISLLAARDAIHLIPIIGPQVDVALQHYPYITAAVIPAGTYPGIPETPTVHVQSQLAVATSLPDDLIYNVTRRLWSEATLARLRLCHPRGASITLASALAGAAVPLHPGARRYYQELGLVQ
jgi:uncharacterized protein